MIGTGLILILLLIGLRLSLKLLRYRSLAIFILLVGAVAVASIGSAGTPEGVEQRKCTGKRPIACAALSKLRQELPDFIGKRIGLFDTRQMPGTTDQREPAARDQVHRFAHKVRRRRQIAVAA